MTAPLHIGVIMGSAREGRLCDRVTAWVVRTLQGENGLRVQVIDPRTALPAVENHHGDSTMTVKQRLAGMDGFIVVTPEYNHSFPAVLKQLIDSAYDEWQTRPVGFVSYGGLSGGIRAVEQLRQVFAELHAVTLRDGVAFADIWRCFDDHGELVEPGRAEAALHRMASRLRWWARATREARLAEPYEQAG
ncbi:NADPH-dependent oxidoreductase [Marinobacter halodurans]|uniref:NADPH-dependent oxidoreductase n=1 Tax=Marinobacter halodurans TaxID=2528979 RepID=A0ABY1ZK25_9GAMM|nr:NAD(P)H-dependent oxidoreductase [Marinobacter halodurans]TBW50749.1 NADPH-dependent oxidoreductase [Marinobacter halodurans]